MDRFLRGGQRERYIPLVLFSMAIVPALLGAVVEPPLSSDVLIVSVVNSSGAGQFAAPVEDGVWDPNAATYDWVLTGPVDIPNATGRDMLARILNAEVHVKVKSADEFEIEMDIGVVGGSTDTEFEINSALVTVPTIPLALAKGRAFATFTVTDIGADGACLLAEGPPGMGAYRCYFNGPPGQGDLFTHLISAVCIDGGGTVDATQFEPLSGYKPFGDEVRDLSAQIAFTLTPGDIAFATTFTDGPAPPPCLCDLNHDSVVSLADLAEFLASYGAVEGDPRYDADADFDGDGMVGLVDISLMIDRYGSICSTE